MSDVPAVIAQQGASAFDVPVPSGFKSDNGLHRRNLRAIADFLSNPQITNATIKSLVVGDANISDLSVSKLTTGTLQADVLLSAVIRTALTSARVEIDASGLRAYDANGSQTVSIETTGAASFEGAITALSMLVSGDATFTGDTLFDAGASVSFGAGGTGDPIAAPLLSWDLDSFAVLAGASYTARAFHWSPGASLYKFCDPPGKRFVAMSGTGVFSGSTSYAHAVPYGICDNPGNTATFVEFYNPATNGFSVQNVTASTVLFSLTSATATANGLTHNGTNLVFLLNRTGTTVNYRIISETGTAVTSGTLTLTQDNVYDICFDGTYYYVVTLEGTVRYARAFDTSWARQAAQDFVVGTGDSRGLTIRGSQFQSITNDAANVEKYSGWVSASTQLHARYEWYNSGSTQHSLGSPDTTIAFQQQWRLSYTTPDFPTGADRAKMYLAFDSSASPPSQTSSSNKLQSTSSTRQQFLSTWASGGAAIDTTNNFAGGTPATLVLPKASAAPSSPSEGQIYHNTTTHKAQVYDGTTWNNLW